MLHLLHGDHLEISRRRLNELKVAVSGRELRQLDGRILDETALVQAVTSDSLFSGQITVIIENLFGRLGRKTKLIEKLAQTIVSASGQTDIIIWEDREVGTTVVKNLGPKAKIEVFKFPVVIFQFLDSLKPGGFKQSLDLFTQVLESDPPELVFVMLVKRVRQLVMLADGVKPADLQSWQAGRLTTQARAFNIEKLLALHKGLLSLEYKYKTGATPFNLQELIDQWIMEI